MMSALPEELQTLAAAFDANERRARELVTGLTEAEGIWQPAPGSWSVAECLDHLAISNRVYVDAMEPAARRARDTGRMRRRPAVPGVFGRWFANSLEPSSTRKLRAPKKIVPRQAPPSGTSRSPGPRVICGC